MASLAGVDSNGVSQEVIDVMEQCRGAELLLDMAVSQRDAEYIAECLRVLLQEQRISERLILCLIHNEISDEAVEIFFGFLRESQCHLVGLILSQLPPQQFRRLLESLHTNTSVKDLVICHLRQDEGASWIADLLRHKTDFTKFHLFHCRIPFTQILPLLRNGQPHLKSLGFEGCRINSSNDLLLFKDPENTQLFVDNILLSPRNTLKELWVSDSGMPSENRPLMVGFQQNTSIVELFWSPHDAATRLFIDPIMRRNRYLGHIHDMLGTRVMTVPPAGVDDSVIVPTIPPPCGLWATVMAKVGQGSQGGTPVFMILRDRLATWMAPSLRYENRNELEPRVAFPVAAVADGSQGFQSGWVCDYSNRSMTAATTIAKGTADVDPPSSSATGTEARQSPLHKKRVASTTGSSMVRTDSKKPKSDML